MFARPQGRVCESEESVYDLGMRTTLTSNLPPSSLNADVACPVREVVQRVNGFMGAVKPNTAFRCPPAPVSDAASVEAGFGMSRRR